MKRTITTYLILICLIGMMASPVTNAQESQYLDILRDVPVMEGLASLEDNDIVFDKPEGRIAEAFFFGETVEIEQIEEFYRATLPQLGWIEESPLFFVRETDQLTLKTTQNDDGATVKFLLSPYVRQN